MDSGSGGLRFLLRLCASVGFIVSEAWLNTACSESVRGRVLVSATLASAGQAKC